MLSRVMGRELDTMGVIAWLANGSNRELACEIRRILEQNVEVATSRYSFSTANSFSS